MVALIVDPKTYSKQQAKLDAIKHVTAFLDANGIPHPTEVLWEPDDAKKPPGNNAWHDRGWCWNGIVFVNEKKSRPPVKVPGFSWSYTGYKADLTLPGVLAHENGHHVHAVLDGRVGPQGQMMIRQCLQYLMANEAHVSGYEPNIYEVMAEACRLFILNPKLLEEGRPERYRFLTGHLNLKPVHDVPWREVLKNAHPKLIAGAESWLKR